LEAAHDLTSAYADGTDQYQRFIAGKLFGDMIAGAAANAALETTDPVADADSIRTKAEAHLKVVEARAEAIRLKNAQYTDTRATDAVEIVLDAVISNAVAALTEPLLPPESVVRSNADQAGRDALAVEVMRFELPADAPTPDYTEFVRSDLYQTSADVAAEAAAKAAVAERKNNALYTDQSLEDAARIAAYDALRNAYAAAARAVRTELPLAGDFGPGLGDPRLRWEIARENGDPLDDPALTGTIYLPASHPTNPFRHRRHPDHTIGFDVRRTIRIDFEDPPDGSLESVGYGIDQIRGIYREEINGLHKGLGPQKALGLQVEGTLELNRISLIDALNAL
jgi:hypothetical protein